jgi:PAS domain S-box-containing protein
MSTYVTLRFRVGQCLAVHARDHAHPGQTESRVARTDRSTTPGLAIPCLPTGVLDVSRQGGRARNWAFFRQAVDQVGTGIAAYDEAGSIHYANRAYAAMLGTTVDDLEGTHITRVNPEFDREQFDGYWASFAENETRSREAINRRLDDGTEDMVRIGVCVAVVGPRGEPPAALAAAPQRRYGGVEDGASAFATVAGGVGSVGDERPQVARYGQRLGVDSLRRR